MDEELKNEDLNIEEPDNEEKKEYPDNVVEVEEENEKPEAFPKVDTSMLMAYAGPAQMNPGMLNSMMVAAYAGPQQMNNGFITNQQGPSMMLVYAAPPFPNPFNGGPRTPAEPEADPEPSEDTCFCSMCGGKFPKTARFCPYCGYKNILNGGGGKVLC